MGKLILCSGLRTKRPYSFPTCGIRVYSMEELCYFLYHHVYMIEEELFHASLIEWIGTELKLPERAEKLRQLKQKQADAKTLVTVILCSADYYTEYEIKSFLKELDTVMGMPMIKRNSIKASNYLKQQLYREAEAEYERLLETQEAKELSPEDYGDILHNLAVAKLHTTSYCAAADQLEQAYLRNQREESLRQYLFALRLAGSEELYRKKLEEYQASEELRCAIEDMLNHKKEEAVQSSLAAELQQLKQMKLQGNINEFYRRTQELLDGWKSKLRQI
jgi:hypothetical protein